MPEEITITLTRDELEALHIMSKNYMRASNNPAPPAYSRAIKTVGEALQQNPKERLGKIPHTTASETPQKPIK